MAHSERSMWSLWGSGVDSLSFGRAFLWFFIRVDHSSLRNDLPLTAGVDLHQLVGDGLLDRYRSHAPS